MNGLTLLIGFATIGATVLAVRWWEHVEARRLAEAAEMRARAAEFRARLAVVPGLERPGVSHGISAVRGGRGGGAVPDVRAIYPRTVTTDGPGWPHR